MRLSDILSKPPKDDYIEIEGFLEHRRGNTGQTVNLSVGKIRLNYYCTQCEDLRTFQSCGKLSCIFIDKYTISIDCVLTCGCGAAVQAWFLIESNDIITSRAPKVRIIKKSEHLPSSVKINSFRYEDFSILLDKAEQAYRNGLGAGAVVYLRKVFEKITTQTANTLGIEYNKYEGGNPKNFRELLKQVDETHSIIPKEFSSNGYKLYTELSNIVHGEEYNEEIGLNKFEALYRLVIGILENVRNSKELEKAKEALGWCEDGKDKV